MTYGQVLHTVPADLRTLFRKYEETSKKLINITWSIEFNSICLKENILPNYTRIRHHDPAVATTNPTLKYRRYLIEREIANKLELKSNLECMREGCLRDIESYDFDPELKDRVNNELCSILSNSNNVTKTKTIKKLNALYLGHQPPNSNRNIVIKDQSNSFVNLSDYSLSKDEIDFLNLGTNCHVQPRYSKLHKQCEIEAIYQALLHLESKKSVCLKPELADQLRCEGSKHRNIKYNSLLTKTLRDAAKNLKTNKDIVIRKADKSATYVILNKIDYLCKLNSILSDTSKFRCISKDPTNLLKQKANNLIEAVSGDFKINKIIGDYQPGYIYGNVKLHKANNPLRPIISQIPMPTYSLAKTLNKLISPYVPNDYMINSSNDFVDLIHSNQCKGIIGSLDVESLFTNVPIDDTIKIILENVYDHPVIPPPKIPAEMLKQLLMLCTKEAPFRCPEGNLYVQIEGVAMGSPLGPTFANFYMGNLEKHVFSDPQNEPRIYARYVDDTFVEMRDESEIKKLRDLFQENSVLKFTYEMNINNKLPFLDVLVQTSDSKFKTSVYHKPSDQGTCLNGNSECTDKYKNSFIHNYLNRAYIISETWEEFHHEVLHMKQLLVNNNYSNSLIDNQIHKFVQHKNSSNKEQKSEKTLIPLYYQAQTHANYKIDERMIKSIIYNNTKCIDPNKKLNLLIYYKNPKTANFIMKNNLLPPPPVLQQTNVIYKFVCPMPHSQAVEYIGFTQTKLSRRLTLHGQNGSIYRHFQESHNCKPTREQLTQNTTIIARDTDRHRLTIKEALLILHNAPLINKQFDNFTNTLKLQSHRNTTKPAPVHMPSTNGTSSDSSAIQNTSDISTIQDLNISILTPQSSASPSLENETDVLVSPRYSNYDNYDSCILPDMRSVLKHFGVDPLSLNEVPLEKYHWWTFTKTQETAGTPTISQRIGSMTRRARYSQSYHQPEQSKTGT